MSKEIKPGLFKLEWSDEQEESIYSLSDEEIDRLEREVVENGLNVVLPSMTPQEQPVVQPAEQETD